MAPLTIPDEIDQFIDALCSHYGVTPARADRDAIAAARKSIEARLRAEGADATRALAYSELAEQEGNLYLAAEWATAASVFEKKRKTSREHEKRVIALYGRALSTPADNA